MPDFNTLKSGIQLSTPESLGIKGLWSLEPFQHQPLIITVPAFVEGLGCLRHCQNHSYDWWKLSSDLVWQLARTLLYGHIHLLHLQEQIRNAMYTYTHTPNSIWTGSMSYELSLAFLLEMVGKSSTFDSTDYHIHRLQVWEFARAGVE